MGIVIDGISKRFITKHKQTITLENVNLTINQGEFVCLLGPSGCGKSTLLNIIAGLVNPTSGVAYMNNEVINTVGVERAVMFQESALFPWLKVIENVEFGMKIAGVPKKERRERALKYLEMVYLSKFKDCYIHELSGGMKQRVALARALTLDSDVLLMDEPFAALDSQTKAILQIELQKIWTETKKTIIFVTHSVEEAVLLGSKVVVMAASPGRIKKEYSINLDRPRKAESSQVNFMIREIMGTLREEVEKVAKNEYDSGWNIEKDRVLYTINSDMGANL
ncbi:MAG: ABC transporter ATP-binding protein [Clostridium sp.]|uniref:ABC transporter ATP-binding protein n=1 Tax=Clostridium sp. TaxID=1506 RepID=UPI002FC64241